jgi:hypothetical protein
MSRMRVSHVVLFGQRQANECNGAHNQLSNTGDPSWKSKSQS